MADIKKKRMMILLILVLTLIELSFSYADNIQIKNIGQIGFNDTNQEYTPIRSVIIETNYTPGAMCKYTNDNITISFGNKQFNKIISGNYFSCGITSNGSAYCWGINSNGQLGNGDVIEQHNPVPINITLNNWRTISLGTYHTCGILTNGSAYCWGSNSNGQLGNGDVIEQHNPVPVNISYNNWTTIDLGAYHTCGILTNGSAYCWGYNNIGFLGNGNIIDQHNPVPVNISYNNWTTIGLGAYHTCGILTNGSAYCWGDNIVGQLGNGNIIEQHNPVPVNISYNNWTTISLGTYHTCGILTNGSAYCWGINSNGQLGNGNVIEQHNPVPVNISYNNWTTIGLGTSYTCGILTNGSAYCWGRNNFGQLGNGDVIEQHNPVPVNISYNNWTTISLGAYHTCGILTNGSGNCWGQNTNGELGNGNTTTSYIPIKINLTYSLYDEIVNEINLSWSSNEKCTPTKYWILPEGYGFKTVFAILNLSNGTRYILNDTIFYNFTGVGLDLTPPSNVNIFYDRFTNSNNTISIEFSDAIDAESNILKIPLVYDYQILINSVLNITGDASLKKVEFTLGINQTFNQSDNITVRVIARNSAGLNSTTDANITVDYTLPSDVTISSNISQNNWTRENSIFFNWTSNDSVSGIYGYSYSFSESPNVYPDNSLEIDSDRNLNFTNATFSNVKTINTGKYKFRIKARDAAGNFGNVSTYSVWIDTNSPTKPSITSFEKVYGTNITNFTWTQSYDFESGISNYTIIISNESNFSNSYNYTTPNNSTFNYEDNNPINFPILYAKVYATDKVGNSGLDSSKDTAYDTTEPVITIVRPKGPNPVNSDLPTIALYTDEKAVCYVEKQDNSFEKFMYTNSTFHETQPKETTSSEQYTIKCEDIYGNKAMESAVFSVSSSITLNVPATSLGYIGKNVEINITTALGEIDKDKVKVYIDNVESDFTIFDSGNGDYILEMNAFQETGQYDILVNISGNTDSSILTINPLSLVAKYNITGLSGVTSDNMAYYSTSSMKAGIASDAAEVVSSNSPDTIKINASNNGKIYLFATRKTQNLGTKERYLKDKTFYLNKNPSFGYNLFDDYILKTSLNYKNINIMGNETLNQGSYSIIIKRLKDDAKKTVLVSSEVSNYNNKGVKQYG